MKKIFLIFTLIFTLLNAEQTINTNTIDNSPRVLFTLNDKNYTTEIFPKEFKNFSKQEQLILISKYLFYKLLLQTLRPEQLTYKSLIQKNIQKEAKEIERVGKILLPPEKIFFKEKIIAETIAYNELLKTHLDLDKKAKEFYEEHKKEFFYPKRVEVSQIIVKEKKLALELIEKLKNNDIKLFSKLARKHSISNSKYKGGYIGFIGEKGTDKKSFNILWKSQSNHLVPQILEHGKYYSIVYLFNKDEPRQETFAEKKDEIKKFLLKKEIKLWNKEKFKIIKKETKVKLIY